MVLVSLLFHLVSPAHFDVERIVFVFIGKTTTSCSLAIQLAQVRESVLLIVSDNRLSDYQHTSLSSTKTRLHF